MKSAPFATRIPASLRNMGDRLIRRKKFAQNFLFRKTPPPRRYLQSWLCLTMHRGLVLGYDAFGGPLCASPPQFLLA